MGETLAFNWNNTLAVFWEPFMKIYVLNKEKVTNIYVNALGSTIQGDIWVYLQLNIALKEKRR